MLHTDFHIWDAVLLVVVSLQATAIAYVPSPQWKAFIYTLPFPFFAASLAVGRPIDASNLWALALLLAYTQGVRWLHAERKLPIVVTILVCTLAYCIIGLAMTRVLDTLHILSSDWLFWVSFVLVLLAGFFAVRAMPPRDEPSLRTPLPIWVKLPLTVLIVLTLILLKKQLGAFTTMFPMVGVLAAYESRRSLWTMSRRVSLFMFALGPMIAACRFAQSFLHWPLTMALVLGVLVYLPILIALTPSFHSSVLQVFGYRAQAEEQI